MARKVFFSFHYERDNWRASQVRNHWVTKLNKLSSGYLDKASWENLKRKGDEAIKRWINSQMYGTSVTVVLIGTETYRRRWVQYEIKRTCKLQHGLIGIYIHRLKNDKRQTSHKGKNPFDYFEFDNEQNRSVKLSNIIKTYDWKLDDGYSNFRKWVERAARQVGL